MASLKFCILSSLDQVKNSKVLIVFFISCFIGALCQNLCIDSCPRNEVFSECKGAGTCQMTCSTRNSTIGECECVSGCICITGYIRDANTYKCIKISSCPPIDSKTCARNEVFSECKGGGTCQMTCSTRNSTIGECECVSGCICKAGYIRDADTYNYVRKSSCPPIPKVNSTSSQTHKLLLIAVLLTLKDKT